MAGSEERLEAILADYLNESADPDLRFLQDGERAYSAREIADEIRKGTEFGREHLAVLLIQRKLDQSGNATVDDFVRSIEEVESNPHFIEDNL